jgi:hypothetical protein
MPRTVVLANTKLKQATVCILYIKAIDQAR